MNTSLIFVNRRPRVLMVAPTGGTYGGIETFTARIAREVIDDGDFDVRVVFRLRGDKSPQLEERISSHGFPWRLMRRPDWRYLKDLLWADVVNCHFPLIYATFPAKAFGKKLVITVENRHMPLEHRRFHRMGLSTADLRWYISAFVGRSWEGRQLAPGSEIIPAVSELPDLWTAPAERRGFFFTARWVPLKGLEQLVEAYATAAIDRSRHRLALYGDGPLRPEIEATIQRMGIDGFVDRPGFVDHQEKVGRMASSLWNVAPAAFEEDLGLTPIEARACGVPSIVSNIGGLPEAAGEAALFCDAGDIQSLRSRLEEAAAMGPAEYELRATIAKGSLTDYLPKPRFYTERFKRLLGI
jgi:glycosyltransferase involved in cell wall biosynthesis